MTDKTAKEKFKVGDQVRLNVARAEAVRVRCYSGGRGTKGDRIYSGRVVGFGESPYCVRVLPHGRKTPSAYNMDLWELDAPQVTHSEEGAPC